MAERQTDTFPIRGLNLSVQGHQTERGDCRLLENLVAAGPAGRASWEVPSSAAERGSFSGILSLGWQRRDTLGDLADTENFPDQSLNRLVALKDDGLYVIDPGNGYRQRQLHEFTQPSSTRRATFSSVGRSTVVSVVRGSPPRRPEVTLELRDDAVQPLRFPPVPAVSLSYTEVSNDENLPEGTYVWRWAWELEDGTVGPASGPLEEATGTPATSGNTFEATFTIESYPRALPSSWRKRIASLRLVAHPQLTDDNGNVTTEAINAPGFFAARFDSYEPNETLTYGDSREEILGNEPYPGTGLKAHEIIGGATQGYNKRLLLGDTAYDLYRPQLQNIVEWEAGVQNAGGDDYWLAMRVTIETSQGKIQRLSEPLPFDTSHADGTDGVNTRSGLIFYREARALTWEWFQSSNYTGDVEAADWEKVAFSGTPEAFEEPQASGFTYVRVASEPVNIVDTETATQEITDDSDWTDQLYASESEWDAESGSGGSSDTPHDATIDIADFTTSDLTAVTVDATLSYDTDENGSTASASASGKIIIEVYDGTGGGGTLQDSYSREAEGAVTITLDAFTLSTGSIRIRTEAEASASASGDDYASASASVEADTVTVETSSASSGQTFDLTTQVNSELDRNPNKIIFSRPFRPLDLRAENLVYAGSTPEDVVRGMEAVGQEVSTAQFGEYPIVVFQKESVRVLRVGTDPFVQAVDLIEADAGLVGRRAAAPVEGRVVAALDTGVYEFAPQQQAPPLSAPLHDPGGDVLEALGPDTSLASYQDRSRGRKEIWVCLDEITFCYSVPHGAWTSLTRKRADNARAAGRQFGVTPGGALVEEEVDASSRLPVRLQTAVLPLGPIGLLKRVYEAQLRQPAPLEDVGLQLVATDPDPSNKYVGLGAAPLTASTIDAGLQLGRGLGPGFVLDVSGEGAPGQAVEAVSLDWEVRGRRLRDHQARGTPGYDNGRASPLLVLVD